ncbi:hypothetical protein PINS_up024260 [Pythium insidiosum]|nr:hypothetical protein PINS_up024260 [Pythium insidiosum]
MATLGIVDRERAAKALVHAVLRVNTELRALYRQSIAASGTEGMLLEVSECRRALAERGVFLSVGQLERMLAATRAAQQLATGGAALEIPTDAGGLAELPEVIPPSRLLVFREFVELARATRRVAATAGARARARDAGRRRRRWGRGRRSRAAPWLAETFTAFHDALAAGGDVRNATITQLFASELLLVLQKHHDVLHRMFHASASVSKTPASTRPETEEERDDDDGEDNEQTVERREWTQVPLRGLLRMLRALGVVGDKTGMRVRDALQTLHETWGPSGNAAPLDPFFIETQLSFAEFTDAVVLVLLAQQQQQQQQQEREQQQTDHTPLFARVDQFLHDASTSDALPPLPH